MELEQIAKEYQSLLESDTRDKIKTKNIKRMIDNDLILTKYIGSSNG